MTADEVPGMTVLTVIPGPCGATLQAEDLHELAGPDVGSALKPNSSSAWKPVTFWSNLVPASDDTSIRNSQPM